MAARVLPGEYYFTGTDGYPDVARSEQQYSVALKSQPLAGDIELF
jgi:hypothetical protein